MSAPYLQPPLRGLEDVFKTRAEEREGPAIALAGMPETPEAVALCLLVMLLDRRGAPASDAEVLDLYRQCTHAANGRFETEPAPWRQ
jgi:hypothetical protein